MASERQNSLGVELRDRIVSVQLAHVTVVSRPDDWHHGICHCGAPIYSAMTDDLRDRIAAVIRREVPCHPPAADRVAARRGMKLIRQALAHRYTNPDHPAVADALTRRCDQCGAPPGQPCHNHIAGGGPLPGRTVHHGRTEAP